MDQEMSRRPYIRELPKTTWWLRRGRYKRYIAREVTSIFIGAYTAVLLLGIERLSEGAQAYQGFLDALDHPLSIVFHVLALAFAAYHSTTWFAVTPKAIRIQIGEGFAPEGAIAGIHYVGWIVVSLVVLLMVGL
ncbi:MAG: fumarate reductase subunit C [Gammaproteobacteria bacterium]|nr:MAG: fumarate reductase subunit C [Gammaproteobacteria bacterium]